MKNQKASSLLKFLTAGALLMFAGQALADIPTYSEAKKKKETYFIGDVTHQGRKVLAVALGDVAHCNARDLAAKERDRADLLCKAFDYDGVDVGENGQPAFTLASTDFDGSEELSAPWIPEPGLKGGGRLVLSRDDKNFEHACTAAGGVGALLRGITIVGPFYDAAKNATNKSRAFASVTCFKMVD